MQSCLIDNAVGELRQTDSGIKDLVAALYVLSIIAVGLPKTVLAQLVGFFNHHFTAVERFHDFHGSTGNAVGTSKQQRPGLKINNAGGNIAELGHLPGHGQPRGTATDDKYIDLRG